MLCYIFHKNDSMFAKESGLPSGSRKAILKEKTIVSLFTEHTQMNA